MNLCFFLQLNQVIVNFKSFVEFIYSQFICLFKFEKNIYKTKNIFIKNKKCRNIKY